MKDLTTRKPILRSDSTGDLYPLHKLNNKATTQPTAFLTASYDVWHRRLAHHGDQTLNFLLSTSSLSCNKRDQFHLCPACQFAKHTKLPFFTSTNTVKEPFEIIHYDLWTSLIPSISGIRYYILFLDHLTHFLWVYPMWHKHETYSKFVNFTTYVKTQFGKDIKSLQCDNGGEFNNNRFHEFFATKGITFRFSCPYSSQQNGKSERMIRTINNAVRSLLFQAHLPSTFWVEALHTAVHILNLLPSKTIQNRRLLSVLFNKLVSFSHLRVLVVYIIETSITLIFISFHQDLQNVFSLAILKIIVDTCVMISTPEKSSSHAMWALMKTTSLMINLNITHLSSMTSCQWLGRTSTWCAKCIPPWHTWWTCLYVSTSWVCWSIKAKSCMQA